MRQTEMCPLRALIASCPCVVPTYVTTRAPPIPRPFLFLYLYAVVVAAAVEVVDQPLLRTLILQWDAC